MKTLIPDNVSQHTNVYDVLVERGLIEQCTDPDEFRELLGKEKIKFYIGFDATADCLHVGHFIPIITMLYMQKYGHTPVVLLGGGTTEIGDPSGRSDMRKVMSTETIDENCRAFKKLFERFFDFDDEWEYSGNEGVYKPGHQNKEPIPAKAISVNNAEWIRPCKYTEFSRVIGTQFNVNTMLRAECFKSRMERNEGLSFFEFCYMTLQAYDFYVMARDFDLKAQFGGNDQWSNIIAGVDLTRKLENKKVYGLTVALLTNSEGNKMGKTAKGALWLDESRVPVYEFFQYWRNVGDADVNKCLRMLTFLPMDEVNRLSALEGAEINKAKEVLAYEVTKLVHGEEKAKQALETSRQVFAAGQQDSANIPTVEMDQSQFLGDGMGLAALLKELKLATSNSDAFRTIEQGGIKLNGETITDRKYMVTATDFRMDKLVIQKGKKKFLAVTMK
ncbi:MAG: tyrosine--tRNA ligase [Mogibacterium sp.]|nr:tyrosine--tRNA ligase [Mogibacterium sp.]